MDQRTCIKFCVKNEIKCADAFRMLTVAYGEATLDRSNVYRWYKMFSEDREYVNDEERAGRPSTSTTDEKVNEVEKMILANRRISVIEVAEDLNISIGSCHSIFINDLGMRRVAAKFVPKLLNCDQKQHRMNIANEMLDSVRDDPNLLQRVITGDEAWVYGYDVETKAQSSQWKLPHEPRPKKAPSPGRTVNKEYYLQVMRNLREEIRQKRPDLWKNKNWLLHHDNAPAHTSLLVRDFLAKNSTLMMPQPPFSPDLAPCLHNIAWRPYHHLFIISSLYSKLFNANADPTINCSHAGIIHLIQEEEDLQHADHQDHLLEGTAAHLQEECRETRSFDPYRREITGKDPLPRIDDTLESLREASIFSTMDMKSGYWQIEFDEANREKTAFVTPDGLFEFKVIPFGLCNAPATFERIMDNLLRGLKWTI
ncbi:hypothetical protein LAZ67_15001241 [Cordylochernes scorpioides]|uniref:Reverse transcriptase domain-containing protein n=1 Tax=Cordylochernes scorpioides TaxID=51811 RepID=A0ABY6LC47_9ARAC|nr:hypothetical protein LAZ67_15001241 [Cordylochernes scorpioides]